MLNSIDKIEITFQEVDPHLKKELHFEKGKNKVKTIKINDENRFIEIEYEDDKWDGRLIPLSIVKTISYKIKSLLLGSTDHLKIESYLYYFLKKIKNKKMGFFIVFFLVAFH